MGMRIYAANDYRPQWQPQPASHSQMEYISSLMKKKGISAEVLVSVFSHRPETKSDASKVIDWLKAQTAQSSAPQAGKYEVIAPLGKDGKPHSMHYAIEVGGEVKFYRVKRGRKAGVWFVDVQASDDYYPLRNSGTRTDVLDAIAVDPKAALARYGQLIGSCGRCGRTLTSEYRELGIGPICIDK